MKVIVVYIRDLPELVFDSLLEADIHMESAFDIGTYRPDIKAFPHKYRWAYFDLNDY